MSSLQVFTLFQILTILTACILSLLYIQDDTSPERKFIQPYIFLNMASMLILGWIEFIHIPRGIIYIAMVGFAFCEIFYLPNYIGKIIGEKPNPWTQALICISTFLISIFYLKRSTSITYLFTNLYISVFVFKYFLWLFKRNNFFNLNRTRHYWITMGICICYAGSIPYWISEIFIIKIGGYEVYNKIADSIFIMYITLNIAMYLLFYKAFLCKTQH